ncbi:MAG: glycosyltransferase [Tepidisphaerales bacterium]
MPIRHFVLATFGSHGDVHPFVGLGKALAARGHRVTVHTSGYFEPLVRRAGLDFSAVGTAEEFLREISNPLLWHPRRGYEHVFGRTVVATLRRSVERLRELLTPETVLVNSTLALSARVMHDAMGCPGATVHLSPVVIRSSVRPARMSGVPMPSWFPAWLNRKIWETGDRWFLDPLICPELNRVRAELGLPPVSRPLDGWWNHPGLVVGLWPDFFGPPASDWPGQLVLTGFPLYDERDISPMPEDLDRFLRAGSPPVAFTPGTAMRFGGRFFEAAVEACRRLRCRGLLLTRHPEQLPPRLPPDVMYVPYAPFSELLPRCVAIVHHGGIGTTAQALRAGIPQVITFFSHDQPDNAERLRRLNVGIGLPAPTLNGRRLAGALETLLGNAAVGEACSRVAARVTRDGLERTAELLESRCVAELPASS